MDNYCVTCASTDRRLVPLKSLSKLSSTIKLIELEFNIEKDSVCWECEALIWKIYKFRRKALAAQKALKLYKDRVVVIKPLSNLRIHHNNKPNFNIVHSDDVQIKKEPHSDNDNDSDNEIDVETNEHDVPIEINLIKQECYEPDKCVNVIDVPKKEKYKKNELLFDVKVMSKEEMEKARDADRDGKRFKTLPFRCESCIVSFFDEDIYTRHMNLKHGKDRGNLWCDICLVRFNRADSLKLHVNRHYRLYQCRLCTVHHHNLNTMLLHYSKQHDDCIYACRECGKVFLNQRQLRYHREVSHQMLPQCDYCGVECKTKSNLRKHIALKHTEGDPLVQCRLCSKIVKKSSEKAHELLHSRPSRDEAAYCAECDVQFKTRETYARHVKYHSSHNTTRKKQVECPHCNKGFINRYSMGLHIMAVHLKKYPYECHLCDKKFTRKHILNYHILEKHKGVSPPKNKFCPYCQKGFSTNRILQTHVLIHTGEKPHECQICHMRFTQKTTLVKHVKGKHEKTKEAKI